MTVHPKGTYQISWRTFLLFVAGSIFSFVIFLFLAREYRAIGIVIVTTQSDTSAETVAGNLSFLVEKGVFYDRLIAEHSDLVDPMKGESRAVRDASWSRVAEAKNIPGTSIIELSLSAPSESQASALFRKSVETLYGFSDRLFGNVVNIVPVGDALVSPTVRMPFLFLGISLAIGVLFAWAVSFGVHRVTRQPFFQSVGDIFSQKSKESLFQDDNSHDEKIYSQTGQKQMTETLRPVGSFEGYVPVRSLRESHSDSNQPEGKTTVLMERDRSISSSTLLQHRLPKEPDAEDSVELPKGEQKEKESMRSEPVIVEMPIPASVHDSRSGIVEKNQEEKEMSKQEPKPFVQKGVLSIRTGLARENIEDQLRNGEVKQQSIQKIQEKAMVELPVLRAIEADREKRSRPETALGALPSIPADEFSWEKYLFTSPEKKGETLMEAAAEEQGKVLEQKNAETHEDPVIVSQEHSSNGAASVSQKREPTPEELKARLNRLLRGEL